MRHRQIFVDLDGVLADFDGQYKALFGQLPDRDAPTPPWFWPNVERHGTFFRDLPIMPDALELWHGLSEFHRRPIVLTGIPDVSRTGPPIDWALQKREWVKEHIGPTVPVIACRSRDKRRYGSPGDVLIDDWRKYKHLWEDMGGIFVLHTSAASSLKALKGIYGR